MRIGSWNVNSLRVRLPHLQEWLATDPVDVLGLQELKMQDDQFPFDALAEQGWHAISNGQKTYNGVALLSKKPMEAEARNIPGLDDDQRRVIAATVNGVRIICVYVVNGQALGSEKFAYKMRWLTALHQYVRSELEMYPRLALVGDFNIAPGPEDTHDPKKWEGDILCSDEERGHLQGLLGLGLKDCFELRPPEGTRFTWWDYRQAAFRRDRGLRIDHILASDALAASVQSFTIHLDPRKWERPSDHAPVTAEFTP